MSTNGQKHKAQDRVPELIRSTCFFPRLSHISCSVAISQLTVDMETKSRTWVDSARPDHRVDLWCSTGCSVPVKLSCECKGQQRICICRNSETQKQDIKWQTGHSATGATAWRMRYDGRSSSKRNRY